MQNKQTILILAAQNIVSNPMIYMYVKSLQDEYRLMIACLDPDQASQLYPEVKCVRIAPERTFVYSIKQWFRTTKVRANKSGPSSTAPVQPIMPKPQYNNPDKGGEGFDWKYLMFHVIGTLLSAFQLMPLPKPDLILVINGDPLTTARLLAAIWRIPYLYAVYEIWPNQMDEWSRKRSRAMAFIEKVGINGAVKIITVDYTWTNLLVRRYKASRSRFIEICTCPDLPDRNLSFEIDQVLKIYYHGGYTLGRGLENLIQSMASVSGAHLYLRGFGALEPALRDLVQKNDLHAKVTFLEPVKMENLAGAAAEFDLGVFFTSQSTTNGRYAVGFKFFENMAGGLATVCTTTRTRGPFMNKHKIGMTISGCDTEEITSALQYCVDHPEQVAVWKKQARALAESEYNDQVQGGKLLQLVRNCLAPLTR